MQRKIHLTKFVSENRWIILGLVWLAGLVLGFSGFSLYSKENAEAWGIGDIIYRTLQLVAMNSGAVDGQINWMLEGSRFLLPMLSAITLLQALMHLFQEQTQKLRLSRLRDHVVICGMGRKGSRLARELLHLGYKVVIIEKEANQEKMDITRSQGAILVNGDATNKEALNRARINYARNLVCLLGNDSDNLQVAYQAYQLSQSRPAGKLTCMMHLASIDLINLVRIGELSTERDVPYELETFNPYERTARILLKEDSKWCEASSAVEAPISLLVVGLGRLGEQLVIQAGYQWHLLKRSDRLSLTIVDRDAEDKTRNLLQKYPQLNRVCELVPLKVDLTTIGPLQNIQGVSAGNGFKQAFVCLGNPVLSLQVSLNLLQIPGCVTGPIRVRLSREAGLSGILEKPLPGLGEAKRIRLFDIFDYTCSADLILGGVHEMLARELHEIYLSESALSSAHQTWEQLSEDMKNANRQQASRIHQLLGTAGYKIFPMQDWDAGSRTFSKAETEKMARLEHALWYQAKVADGWTYAEQKNEERRTHPDLVGWEELPQVEREKNLATVRQLPALLSQMGLETGRIDQS